MNYDKSLIEVWKWKEEVSESLLNLTIEERLAMLRKSRKKRLALRKKVTTPVKRKREVLVTA